MGKSLPEEKKAKRRICAQVSYLEGKNLEEVEKKGEGFEKCRCEYDTLQSLSE